MSVAIPSNVRRPFSPLTAVLHPHSARFSSFKPAPPIGDSRRCFNISIETLTRKRSRRSSFIVCGGGGDSDQNNLQKEEEEEEDSVGVKAALSVLRFYKREISPLLPKSCRYVPTCSEYSMIAYKKYGFNKGTILTVWRICRCNPLGGTGFDPPRWFGEDPPPTIE